MSKIVDFFPYYDPTGRQVTELRVRMYENIVDEFVICESTKTHSGLPAQQGLESLIIEADLPRNKIKMLRLDIPDIVYPEPVDLINCYGGNAKNDAAVLGRVRERMQKDSLLSVLEHYDDSTFFIISDQDEIINPDYFQWILNAVEANPHSIVKIPMVHLEGRADLRVHMRSDNSPKKWDTPVCVVKKHHLRRVSPISIRGCTQTAFPTIYITNYGERVEDMGWHFSWMGEAKERIAKLEGFAHYDDEHDFLETKSYSNPETKKALTKLVLADGNMPPSCNKHEVLRKYPKSKLPRKIFELPRVCKYLLPPSPLPYRFEDATIDMGNQPEVSARFVYDEFVLDEVYERFNTVKDGDVVLDIGANIGLFPLMLGFRKPAHVYCVEPSDGLFEVLKKNTANLTFPITYCHYGITATTGEKQITKEDWIYGEHKAPTFKTKTFKDFLNENKITHVNFLKIDCEGGEYDIFTEENYDFLMNNVDYIVGEWHMGGMDNGVEKFIRFKNLFLKGKTNFRVFEPYQLQREITKDVLDDAYVQKYFDWWDPRGHAAQFQIYIDNRVNDMTQLKATGLENTNAPELKITGLEKSRLPEIPPPIEPNQPITSFLECGYTVTQDWFSKNVILWDPLIESIKPSRILEIGSFEGMSAIYLIEKCTLYGNVEMHCIDTWEGGKEHNSLDFGDIESRFDNNIKVLLDKSLEHAAIIRKHKGRSVVELSKLIASGEPKFDLIYVDGSHLAADVLSDAILAFELLKVGGTLIFDDYNNPNPATVEFPKLGIDCFLSAFQNKVGRVKFQDQKGEDLEGKNRVLYQLYLKKISE